MIYNCIDKLKSPKSLMWKTRTIWKPIHSGNDYLETSKKILAQNATYSFFNL